jgi:hypothetical protein
MPSLDTSSTRNLRAEPQVGSDVSVSIPHGCAREIVLRALGEIRPNPRNARRHHKRKIRDLANHIMKVGFIGAIIVDETGLILAGHARYLAAKLLGFMTVPTLCVSGLNEAQKRAFLLADNKFGERAAWDREMLAAELQELSVVLPSLELDVAITGFEAGEIEILLGDVENEKPEPEDWIPPIRGRVTTRRGDKWQLGRHQILCGDARDASDYARLVQNQRAAMVFADPPYNVPVRGHVQGRGRRRHAEFAFASGEMTEAEYASFLALCLGCAAHASRDGAVHYVCTDWRHIETLTRVAREIYGSVLNVVVWNKVNAGQGSFYRSQHELIGVFRVGDASHQNNVELGRHGRNRSNVWTYPGFTGFGPGRDEALST